MAKGPLGNSPRDLRDDFVGENVLFKGGEPPKKARNPKKVTSNTFHSKVTGATSNKRPDRAGHFRSGGFVRGKADGGTVDDGGPPTSYPSRQKMAPMPQISGGQSGAFGGKMAPMPRKEGYGEGGKPVPMPEVDKGYRKGGSVKKKTAGY